jgi:putative ATPase
MKELDYGKGYQYDHSRQGNFSGQEFLPSEISGKLLYDPGKNSRENELREWLRIRWKDKYPY